MERDLRSFCPSRIFVATFLFLVMVMRMKYGDDDDMRLLISCVLTWGSVWHVKASC